MENLYILPRRKISIPVQVTGFIFFGILVYLSWHFYLERMLYTDSAFYMFQIMESGKFITALNRYADYIPQILPLLAFKMDYPLHTLLILYSVSFILLHYIIFLFVTLYLKNNGAGIAIMLVSCLGYYHSFYTPMVQLNESIIAAILLWAFIHPETPYLLQKERIIAVLGALATIFYMSFLHPLGIVPILFVIGIEMVGYRRFNDRYLWFVLLGGAGWYLLKFYVFFRTGYDQQHIVPLSVAIHQLPHWRHWPSTRYLDDLTWLHFRNLKWLLVLLVVFSLRKGVVFFLFTLFFIIGFTLLYLVTLYRGEAHVYLEDYYCMYGFFAGLIFVFLVYHPRRRNLALLLSLPLLYSGIARIYNAHDVYTYRVAYLQRIIKAARKKGEHKCIINSKCYPYNYVMAEWDVAFETLFYSSLQGRDSTVTVFIKTPKFDTLCDTAKNRHNVLLGAQFSPLWYTSNDMPEEYFKLPSTGYHYLTHSQDDTSFHSVIYSAENIKMVPLVQSLKVESHNLLTVIPIEITNTSGKIIPAIPRSQNPVCLSYKLYDAKGKLVNKVNNEPIETDIGTESEQGLIINYPMNKGIYYAEPGINTEGQRDWNIPVKKIKITVE